MEKEIGEVGMKGGKAMTDDIPYEKLVQLRLCLVCEHYGKEECDAGAGYSYRDEYGECPADLDSMMDEPVSFGPITSEEWESVKQDRSS